MAYKTIPELLNNEIEKPNDYAFDTTKVSRNPYYQKISDIFEDNNNRLVRMTGDDYFKLVANELNTKWQDLQSQRRKTPNELSVSEMSDLMKKGQKFPTPWIHLNDKLGTVPHFQEGLHRMLAAKDVYGDKAKFPVYLAYNKEESWDDLQDAIDNGSIDDWIQKRNAKILQNQIDYDNKQYEIEQIQKQQDKEDAAKWFKLNSANDVNDELLNNYYKELDKMFQEEF